MATQQERGAFTLLARASTSPLMSHKIAPNDPCQNSFYFVVTLIWMPWNTKNYPLLDVGPQ